ncbi:D-tyrosyl-tRNA(Tyr) deacylase [Candidatus Peregrinibacteria bacterium]|nr:D-tyrosyl-tRNA(Tyr) deacylase [Candidatus Peregrinibacteria bacterium]
MRALIQRVKNASVTISGKKIAEIQKGLLVLLGVKGGDTDEDAKYLVEKIVNLRIFEDEAGKMNLSLIDVKGELLIVSQFTLYADCRKGRRPSFTDAAAPEFANEMYKKFIQLARATGLKVAEGEFGAMMDISLVNWGPVTIML